MGDGAAAEIIYKHKYYINLKNIVHIIYSDITLYKYFCYTLFITTKTCLNSVGNTLCCVKNNLKKQAGSGNRQVLRAEHSNVLRLWINGSLASGPSGPLETRLCSKSGHAL